MPPMDGQVTKPEEVSHLMYIIFYITHVLYSNIYGPWDEAVLNTQEQER